MRHFSRHTRGNGGVSPASHLGRQSDRCASSHVHQRSACSPSHPPSFPPSRRALYRSKILTRSPGIGTPLRSEARVGQAVLLLHK
ncbi:hypothetical protein E2C01_089417 [Portunus trituberculatus]|uniref:Uncharacterized protein n=1 Tax=Portunus trituberculatus TaxID=210409 RepID=A0A5B7JI45_PORTR|nr:hypothetical protein [Portunus trituberculatus]